MSEPTPIDASGPAFPVPFQNFETWAHGRNPVYGVPGMSLRAYLSGQALQGICANPDCEPEDVKHNAIVAVRNADALLAALNERSKDAEAAH